MDNSPRMVSFRSEIQTHVSLLNQISNSVNLKYSELIADTQKFNYRKRRGIFNGIGSVWKSITGNLDASDGEYFNECINKVSQDERHIETLLKNQISVTTSVIKNFNTTIQRLQIDEETFNRDLIEINQSITNIADDLAFYQAQIKTLEICEFLMESYAFVENYLNDALNAVAFARLNILHSSIITPKDLISALQQASQSLRKNNLPLPVYSSSVAQYIDIIELDAFQTDLRIVFVLKVPLIEPESYTLYRLYPIPILDNRTKVFHIVPTTQTYIARDDDSMLYVTLQDLKTCKSLTRNQKICSEVLPYPIDSDAICEAQLLKQTQVLPMTCQVSLLLAKGYNVKQIDQNLWLTSISDPLPITIKCGRRETVTKIINTNSLLQLQPECTAFIGITRVHAKYTTEAYQNVTYRSHQVRIPYTCCNHIPEKLHLPDLKPLKLSKIDLDDLNIAQHKLDQYSDELDKMINKPFIEKHLSWFTISTIIIIILLITLYVFCKCRRKRLLCLTMGQSNEVRPSPPKPEHPKPTRRRLVSFLPRKRTAIHPHDIQNPEEEFELHEDL